MSGNGTLSVRRIISLHPPPLNFHLSYFLETGFSLSTRCSLFFFWGGGAVSLFPTYIHTQLYAFLYFARIFKFPPISQLFPHISIFRPYLNLLVLSRYFAFYLHFTATYVFAFFVLVHLPPLRISYTHQTLTVILTDVQNELEPTACIVSISVCKSLKPEHVFINFF